MRATKIVLATNVWTNDLLERSGISSNKRLPISASLHSVIYLKRPDVYRGIKPTLWDPPNLSYYKMEGETVTALGSLDPEIDAKPIDVHSVIPETAPDEYVEDYVGKIMKRLPGMKDAVPYATVTGLYDMTPDGQAIIDDLSPLGLDNVYVCAGLSGHGFKLSPAYGRIVSDMLNGIDPDSAKFNWKTFSADRFKTGKLIKSRYDEIGTIY
jgi:Glycine/D-amino acid oxidases (deaminating)